MTKDRIRGLNAALAGGAEGGVDHQGLRRCVHEPPSHRPGPLGGAVRLQGVLALPGVQALAGGRGALQVRDMWAEVKPLKGTKRGRGSKTPKALPALVRQPRVDDNSDGDGTEGADSSDGGNQRVT